MVQIVSTNVLINGLRTEFADTYTSIRNRQADGRLGNVMDLGVGATNRYHDFAYFNAAPHMELWRRGDPIPQDAMDAVRFTAYVYEWGRRVQWSKWDREDDQTQSLMDAARMAGQSAALLPERFFFDLLTGGTTTLPVVPNAPDGAAFFQATNGAGGDRFGLSGGNLISGTGYALPGQILADYYTAIGRFMRFQDGKGQPLLSPELVANGVTILFNAANLQVFEQAFLQMRQGMTLTNAGSTTTASGIVGGVQVSNVVQDSARNVTLWPTARITDNDWYIFLNQSPKKSTFLMNRKGILELTSLEGDNNSDLTRTSAIEYMQWETRQGAGIALPYGAIKVDL